MPIGIYIRTAWHRKINSEAKKRTAHLMMGELNVAKRPGVKKKISEKLKGKHMSPETEFKKGHKSFAKKQGEFKECIICKKKFYVSLGEQSRQYCSKKCTYERNGKKTVINCKICDKKIFVSPSQTKRSICSIKCRIAYVKTLVVSEETRHKMSESMKKVMTKEKIRQCLKRRPKSGLEMKVENTINKYNLPYKFVGNGKFFIENINPDFVNTNGEKKAVEVYWKRHKDEFREGGCKGWMEKRKTICRNYGWEIIFIEGTGITEEKIINILRGGEYHCTFEKS